MNRFNLGKNLLVASMVLALTPALVLADDANSQTPVPAKKVRPRAKRKAPTPPPTHNTQLQDIPDPVDLNSD